MFQKSHSLWWIHYFKWGIQHNQSILLDVCPFITKWKGKLYLKRINLSTFYNTQYTSLLQISMNIRYPSSSGRRENIVRKIPVKSIHWQAQAGGWKNVTVENWNIYIRMNQSSWCLTSWINKFADYVFVWFFSSA